ncbi:hypothetical protein [Paenibacillus allorhizoplanae]|nr:hypothetical protein [Paenibacillus allorhizoplanae]
MRNFEQVVRTADVMNGQPKAIFPNFKLTAIDCEGKELIKVTVWIEGMGMIEVNDTYWTLTEDGRNKILKLLKDAEALRS